MTFTRLVIPDRLLAEVIDHARTELPNECCGLLAGYIVLSSVEPGSTRVDGIATVTARYPVANALRSPTEYESDPRDMLAAFRDMREKGSRSEAGRQTELAQQGCGADDARCERATRGVNQQEGLELLAIYHSHPTSPPIPSRRDVERNTYGEAAAHLIVGLAGGTPEVRAWWLTETEYREAEFAVSGTAGTFLPPTRPPG